MGPLRSTLLTPEHTGPNAVDRASSEGLAAAWGERGWSPQVTVPAPALSAITQPFLQPLQLE